jgi:hypothetical protein
MFYDYFTYKRVINKLKRDSRFNVCKLEISLIKKLYRVNPKRWIFVHLYTRSFHYDETGDDRYLRYNDAEGKDQEECPTWIDIELSFFGYVYIQHMYKKVRQAKKREKASYNYERILKRSQADINQLLLRSTEEINEATETVGRITNDLLSK